MRLEDLDGPRAKPELADAALRDLEWLGLDWDGPAVVQSAGVEALSRAAEQLAARGLAYACVCSRADVRSAQSAPQQGDAEPRYPGTCRDRYASLADAQLRTGRHAGLRLRVADGTIDVADELVGRATFDVQRTVGDFLVSKRDLVPAYQLAVVVDDAKQGVTEVVRGDDLLESAARQMLLQRALGLPAVRYLHVPLVCDESGRRLAKRHDDSSLAELRALGVDPRALVAWAASTCGMQCDARVTARQALAAFSVATLPRSAVRLSAQTMAELRAAR